MSHIHIPDGVLPIGWWLVGLLIAIGILLIALRKLEKGDVRKRVPYLGVISALMLITMSVPVGALPFHINLTILTGILAGPWLGYVAVFMVNLFLSFLGHGGITVVGINTLILASEVFLGWGIFRLFRRWIKDLPATGLATVTALLISSTLMMGVIGFSQMDWEYALPHEHEPGEEAHLAEVDEHDGHAGHESETLHGEDGDHVEVAGDIHMEDAEHADANGAGQTQVTERDYDHITGGTPSVEVDADHDHGEEATGLAALADQLTKVSFFKLSGLGALLTILIIGIVLEAMVTILMVRFFKKVRPDLLN